MLLARLSRFYVSLGARESLKFQCEIKRSTRAASSKAPESMRPRRKMIHCKHAHDTVLTLHASSSSSIEVHDDFFPSETQEEILRLMERPKWSFTGGRPPNQFWHMDGLEEEPFFAQQLFGLICKRLGREFQIKRIYANGQTALQHGAPHVDDGDLTFLYYCNPIWRRSWKGSLLFVRKGARELDVTDVVRYKPNRALIFPAELPHYAEAPSKQFTGLRVSLAYKLLLPANQ